MRDDVVRHRQQWRKTTASVSPLAKSTTNALLGDATATIGNLPLQITEQVGAMIYKKTFTIEKNGTMATASLKITSIGGIFIRMTVKLWIDRVLVVEEFRRWSRNGEITIKEQGFTVYAKRTNTLFLTEVTFTLD